VHGALPGHRTRAPAHGIAVTFAVRISTIGFPPITVRQPALMTSSVIRSGSAASAPGFEGQIAARVRDAHGTQLTRAPVHAGSRSTPSSAVTLSGIAQKHYGNANRWPIIFAANRHQLQDPDHIFPGKYFGFHNKAGTCSA
jgi:hypothetical protein